MFALNRRQLTEGQNAVLANNYSGILSKKLNENKNSDRARDENGRFLPILETVSKNGDKKEENVARWHSEDASASVSEAVSETDNEKKGQK